ncbi:MAG: class I SAM-dependent methyltransferase [Pseudomonadota bacterium]
MRVDGNLEKYNSEAVVAHYARQDDLQPAEAYLFDRYIGPHMAVLDMGVGGGRTTPALSAACKRYVGADYSAAMIAACRDRFPEIDFRHCDATAMDSFAEGEFDAVVFSFNGIDVIRSDQDRQKCLTEAARVLEPGGVFLFSSHNAQMLGVWPQLCDANGYQVPWRIVRAASKTAVRLIRGPVSKPYWTGEGYVRDPVHGGMDHYVSTPATMKPQLNHAGFEVTDVVGGHYPAVSSPRFSPWFYYACRKIGGTE